MKRYIRTSFDPETDPTDAARAVIDMINSDITTVGNIVKKAAKTLKEHPDDDTRMNTIVNDLAFMQAKLDEIREHYNKYST